MTLLAESTSTGGVGDNSTLQEVVHVLTSNLPEFVSSDEELARSARLLSALAADLLRGIRAHQPSDEVTEMELEHLASQVSEQTQRLAGEDRAADDKAWREWAQQSLQKGAGQAHATIKRYLPWVATTVELQQGVITGDPRRLLEAEAAKWAALWRATSPEGRVKEQALPLGLPPRGLPLHRPAVAELRSLGQSFRSSTAMALDAFRMPHLCMLPSEGLEALATMFQATDVHAFVPRQARAVCMPMLPKPSGGHRLIGLFSFHYTA